MALAMRPALLLTLLLTPADFTTFDLPPGFIPYSDPTSGVVDIQTEASPPPDPVDPLERLVDDADCIVIANLIHRELITDDLSVASADLLTYQVHATIKGAMGSRLICRRPHSAIPPDDRPVLLFLATSTPHFRRADFEADFPPNTLSLHPLADIRNPVSPILPRDTRSVWDGSLRFLCAIPLPHQPTPRRESFSIEPVSDCNPLSEVKRTLKFPVPTAWHWIRRFVNVYSSRVTISNSLARAKHDTREFNPYRASPPYQSPAWSEYARSHDEMDAVINLIFATYLNNSPITELPQMPPALPRDLMIDDLLGVDWHTRWGISETEFLLSAFENPNHIRVLGADWKSSIPLTVHNFYYLRDAASQHLKRDGLRFIEPTLREPAVKRHPVPWVKILPWALLLLLPLAHRFTRKIYKPCNLLTGLSFVLLAAALMLQRRSLNVCDQLLFCTSSAEFEVFSAQNQLTLLRINAQPLPYPSQHIAFEDTGLRLETYSETHHHSLLRPTASHSQMRFTIESGTIPSANSAIPYRRVVVPYWALVILFMVLPATRLLRALYLPLRAQRRRNRNHCPRCNYNLRGIEAARCPECGLRR